MSAKRHMWATIALAATVLALSACSGPPSVADGESSDADLYPTMRDDGTFPAVWTKPDRLNVMLGGSSSCPTVVTEVAEDAGMVRLTLDRTGGPACTADMVIKWSYFILEDGKPRELILIDEDGTEYPLEIVDAPSDR